MNAPRLDDLKDVLRQRSRPELEELALASSLAHARVCEIASYHAPGDGEHEAERHRHASESEMRERIEGKDTEELVSLLAELAVASEATKA